MQELKINVKIEYKIFGSGENVKDLLLGATRPSKRGLQSVLPAVFNAIGLADNFAQIDCVASRQILGMPAARRACVVLVDGLGAEQLLARRGHANNLRSLNLDNAITTVSPATTTSAITAFGTGLMPGQSSIVGYAMRSPVTKQVFNLISWENSGIVPQVWQAHPTLFEQLAERARQTVIIQPQKFVNSGLTSAALRGVATMVGQTLPDRVDCAIRALRADKQMAYLYWGDLDSTGHKYGWQSERWIGELEKFDAEFGRLLRSLPADTLVILTADHGMIDASNKIDIATHATLGAEVNAVAGEERAVQLYTSYPEQVAKRWREFDPDLAWVLTKSEIISSGILGEVSENTAKVIGDVFVFAKTAVGFVDSRVHSDSAIGLVGVHGSLTAAEMYVPLIMEVV